MAQLIARELEEYLRGEVDYPGFFIRMRTSKSTTKQNLEWNDFKLMLTEYFQQDVPLINDKNNDSNSHSSSESTRTRNNKLPLVEMGARTDAINEYEIYGYEVLHSGISL